MSYRIAFTLIEAEVTLYQTNADGTLGAAVWSGEPAENLKALERWINVETRPTGARNPKQHPLVAQYEISISRVWALPLDQLLGFQASGQTYILDLVWTEEDTQQWQRRTFYGVTIGSHTLQARGVELGFTDDQEFLAQYFVADSGEAATPAPAVSAVPLVVMYQGNAGAMPLYTYSAMAGFVPVNTNALATTATIATDGSTIQFAGAGSPVVATGSSGLTVASLHDVFPQTLPRLEFYYGTSLVAAVTPDGFWARTMADGDLPAAADGQFGLDKLGTSVAVLAVGQATATAWVAQA